MFMAAPRVGFNRLRVLAPPTRPVSAQPLPAWRPAEPGPTWQLVPAPKAQPATPRFPHIEQRHAWSTRFLIV